MVFLDNNIAVMSNQVLPLGPGLVCELEQAAGQRPDGRTSRHQFRPIGLKVFDLGHVLLSLGNTKVLASCHGEIVAPASENGARGKISYSVEFGGIADAAFQDAAFYNTIPNAGSGSTSGMIPQNSGGVLNGPTSRGNGSASSSTTTGGGHYVPPQQQQTQSQQHTQHRGPREAATIVQQRIEKVLSHAVDEESLCIVAGKQCWHLSIHVRALNNDGNLADCAVLAALMSLKTYRKKVVEVVHEDLSVPSKEEEDKNRQGGAGPQTAGINMTGAASRTAENKNGLRLYSAAEREPAALSVHFLPIPVTFGFLPTGDAIADPCRAEEQLADGGATLAVNQFGEICLADIVGPVPGEDPTQTLFEELLPVAAERSRELLGLLELRIKEFEEHRQKVRTKKC
ncbi:unnamed protein product [Amoebophrya sp. A25]|nr:unnamed protein product [Amoebophrya sp. A25]|eukprot:GSA25T00019849001.1